MSSEFEKLKVRCPRCRAWVTWATTPTRPFCSEECKNSDLGSWATERYRIPAEEVEPGSETKKPEEDDS